MRFLEQEKLPPGFRREVWPKIRFRPKHREEKELRGEIQNGAFDAETSGFWGDVRVRSARKRPKSGHRPKNDGSLAAETHK